MRFHRDYLGAWLLVGLAIGFFLAPAAGSETQAVRLTLPGLEKGQLISSHDLGILRFEVRFEYKRVPGLPPISFDAEKLDVRVNDQPIGYRRGRSGSGHDDDVNYRMHQITFRPGAPGRKRIAVSYNGMHAEATIDWQPMGRLELLGLVDRQAVFGDEIKPVVRWLGSHLHLESIRLTVNGRARPLGFTPSPGTETRAGTMEGALTPGTNSIELTARDLNGNRLITTKTVYYYPDNRVPRATVFALPMGPMGSLSGPFYRAKTLGLRELKPNEDYPHFSQPVTQAFEQDGLAVRRKPYVLAWFRAVASGPAFIRLERNRYFQHKEWKPVKTIQLHITESEGQ